MNVRESQDTTPQGATQLVHQVTLPLLALLSLTLVTQLASLAYNAEQSFLSIFVPSVIAVCVITIPLAAFGLWLGERVGLGAPLLTDLLTQRPGSGQKLLRDARLAIAPGLGVGALLLILRIVTAPYLPPELPELGHRGALGGLLVSASAAIGEEIWLRLGVMTILAWLFLRLLGHSELKPSVAWPAILLSALVFGLIHLPQLAQSGAATVIGIVGTIMGNTLVGTVCGWLFWRRSLIAAILAHFAVDLVLHVLPAFLR